MRSEFGYVMICKIRAAFGGRFARSAHELRPGHVVSLRCTQRVRFATPSHTRRPLGEILGPQKKL